MSHISPWPANMHVKPKDLIGPPVTENYAPSGLSSLFYLSRQRPVFSPAVIGEMMTDPRILFGLALIKGPIQDKARFEVQCDSVEVKEFVTRQLERFWRDSLDIALTSLEYGYSGSEALFCLRKQPAKPANPLGQPDSGNNSSSSNYGNTGSKPPTPGRPKAQQNPLSMAFPKATQNKPPSSSRQKSLLFMEGERLSDDDASAALDDPNFAPAEAKTLIEFDILKPIGAVDVKAITSRGMVQGMVVNRAIDDHSRVHRHVYLGGPKKFWSVHWARRNPWYGLSRLFGCFIPWWEKWSDGGYRDIRRLWFHKNAFEGGVMYYPAGGSMRDENGMVVPYQVIARELLEKKRTGGMLFFPNTTMDDKGTRAWEHVPPGSVPVPAGLLDYGGLLDKELLEGMGVPTEIIESSGEQGFGASSGRQVPETAFYSILQAVVNPLVREFKQQIAEPLVCLNYGEGNDFDIIPQPLTASSDPGDPMEQAPIDPETGEQLDPLNSPSAPNSPEEDSKP